MMNDASQRMGYVWEFVWACIMLCFIVYVCIERVLGRGAAGRGGVSGGRVIGYVCE